MITIALPQTKENAQVLLSECQELVLIFQKITSTLRNGKIKIENSMEIRN
jgi:hypothetical protein